MSGLGGEVGETDELLSMMKEALEDVEKEQPKQKDALKRADEQNI